MCLYSLNVHCFSLLGATKIGMPAVLVENRSYEGFEEFKEFKILRGKARMVFRLQVTKCSGALTSSLFNSWLH